MRLQPLYDLQQEINRLFIAGSKFAKGDPRLQKHIPVFQKLGEKAPVFSKLAKDIEDLVNTEVQQSPEKLMAISTLLYSVLYTQGEPAESGAKEALQIPNIPLNEVNTEYSYLQLKPVMQALTTSNSGRLEILKDALERNVFSDSRTYQYLDLALADKYAELCDYVEKTIIPEVGKPIVPFLIQNFKYEDKTENVRRLRLLNKFNYPQLPEMVDKILSGPLPALQAEAIHILSADTKNEELIIKLADDKNKLVREAAYMGLVELGTPTSFEKLKDVYINNKNRTNLPAIVTALASSKLPFFFQEVFNQVVKTFEEFITLEKDEKEKVLVNKLEQFKYNLATLANKDNNEVIDFYAKVLRNEEYNNLISAKKNLLENLASDITVSITDGLKSFSKARIIKFYESNIDDIPKTNWKRPLWWNYFYAAIDANYPKEKVFDVFSDQFKRNTISIDHLHTAYSNNNNYHYGNQSKREIFADKIDKRWLDLLYDIFKGEKYKWRYDHDRALRLLDACESDKKKFDELLVRLTGWTMPNEQATLFMLIIDRKIENCFEVVYSAMSKYASKTYFYGLNWLKNIGLWKQFPKEYAAKYEELYKKNPLQVYKDIADEIESSYKNS
ncbi:HEAT repeat domain-containing protein [Dysgonomonas termitidis]|uniref:HEAT repeat domain-containing protein n=1 Tax=Dysgonomonas termitidis TaxID=1516126 RepID=A0ABV9L2L7_9BACT